MTPPLRALRALRATLRTRPSIRALSTTTPRARDLGARFRSPPHPATVVHIPEPEPIILVPKRRDVPVMVHGVRVPPQPIPPGDEGMSERERERRWSWEGRAESVHADSDCCMSGCVHCVLTLYAEDVEAYDAAVAEARAALTRDGVPRAKWPKAVTEDEAAEAVPSDPGMAAFMALENKIKKKPKVDPGVAAFLALEQKIKNKK